jgi:hypothetical protein
MRLIITMPDTLMSSGLVTHHTGDSGASYRFEWSERYAMHIYLGREIDSEEFNKVAPDMFASQNYWFRIVPRVVDAEQKEAEEPQSISQPPLKKRGRPPKQPSAELVLT